MLKIKDTIDLRTLAKKYNMVYCEDYRTPYEDDNYGWIVQVPDEAIKIYWRNDNKDIPEGFIYLNFNYKTDNKPYNILYDLITAGLVEKVEEER